jgi:hypothetical protein
MNIQRSLVMAVLLIGCGNRHKSTLRAVDFQFVEVGMTMREITNRVGVPDRYAGTGVFRWEYCLADGSRILILPKERQNSDFGDLGAWVVTGIGQHDGTNWLWTKSENER